MPPLTGLRPLRKPRVLLLHAPDDDKEYSWQLGVGMMMASLEQLNATGTPTIPSRPLLTSVSFTDSHNITSAGSTPVARTSSGGRPAGDEAIKAADAQRPHARPRRARSHPSHLFTSANTTGDCTPSSLQVARADEADHLHHLRTSLIGADLPVSETPNVNGRQRGMGRGRALMPFLGSAQYSSVSVVIGWWIP